VSAQEARPVGVAMSDGTVRPFNEALGALTELSIRRGKPKSTVVTWWSRSRGGETKRPFPKPLFTISTGPVWFPPDIDGYTPGDGRWPSDDEGSAR
jgi:hypothetical protein